MNHPKHIVPVLAVILISIGASANQDQKGNSDGGSGVAKAEKIYQEHQALEETIQLLKDSGGITVDEEGKIHVDKDVAQDLKDQGRWSVIMADRGGICD